MFVTSPQQQAMFSQLSELKRRVAIQQALREEAIKASGGYPCFNCGALLDRTPGRIWKWDCTSCHSHFIET